MTLNTNNLDSLLNFDIQTRLASFCHQPSQGLTYDREIADRLQIESFLEPYSKYIEVLKRGYLEPSEIRDLEEKAKRFSLFKPLCKNSKKANEEQAKLFFITILDHFLRLEKTEEYKEIRNKWAQLGPMPIINQAIETLEKFEDIQENKDLSATQKTAALIDFFNELKKTSPELALHLYMDQLSTQDQTRHFICFFEELLNTLPHFSEEIATCLKHILHIVGRIAIKQEDFNNVMSLHRVLDSFLEKWKASFPNKVPTPLERSLLKTNALFHAATTTNERHANVSEKIFKLCMAALLVFCLTLIIAILGLNGFITMAKSLARSILFTSIAALSISASSYITFLCYSLVKKNDQKRQLQTYWPKPSLEVK